MELSEKIIKELKKICDREYDNNPQDSFNNGIRRCISYLEENNLINKLPETTNEEPKKFKSLFAENCERDGDK